MSGDNDPRRHDHESDPAHTPDDGWGEEGGASHLGPATHLDAGRATVHEDAEADERE